MALSKFKKMLVDDIDDDEEEEQENKKNKNVTKLSTGTSGKMILPSIQMGSEPSLTILQRTD